jgi:acid phosphatase
MAKDHKSRFKHTQAITEALEPRQLLSAVPTPAHVVVVMEENSSFDEIIGNSQAPYINSLANQGALFSQSFAVTHPSQPNYLALFSGSTQGVTDDNGPISFNSANLRSTLAAVGQTFAGYSEDLPSTGSSVLTSGEYARKHNPWSDFTNVHSSENRPFTAFPTTFDSLPTVSFVVPNLLHDMHDGTMKQADTWLQSNLGAYATWAKTHNSLLVVTWDEDDGSESNQIPTLFYGQPVVVGTYSESINHYNVLRTIENMYGATPVGASASATPITDVWQTTIAQSNTITGTAGVDSITITQDPDHQHVDWTMGTTTAQLFINDVRGLSITGNGGTDQITFNYANGNPFPTKLNLNGTFRLNGLTGTNPLAGVTVDLGASTLYVNYAGSSDPASTLRGCLSNAYNGGLCDHWRHHLLCRPDQRRPQFRHRLGRFRRQDRLQHHC